MSFGADEGLASASPRRVLGFWTLLTLGVNGIVGVGIFFAPSELARMVPGPASALAFVVTALLLLPVAWTYGRLGSAYPEDGGPYVWAREALGTPIAFGVGLVAYASAVLSTAAVVSGLGQHVAPALGLGSVTGRWVLQVGAALLFASVAAGGLRLSARIWSLLTVVKLLPLVLLLLLAPFLISRAPVTLDRAISGEGLARAALLAVFPLQGFEIVAVPAGEARGAGRNVLAASLLSLLGAAVLYSLLQLVCSLTLPQLASSSSPIVQAGEVLTRGLAGPVFALGANVSAVGIAFGMFAMTPRYLAALGTQDLLGVRLAREHRGVPTLALAITTLLVLALVSNASLGGLFILSSLAVLLQYAVSAVAMFRLAARSERGLGRVDRLMAPLSLLSVGALAQSAKLEEGAILAGVLVAGWLCLRLRQALARRPDAR